MNLSPESKATLLTTAKAIYHNYVALDFFKNKPIAISNGKQTLQDICLAALNQQNYQQVIVLNGRHYTLQLLPDVDNHKYKVTLSQTVSLPTERVTPQPLNRYTDEQAVDLLSQQSLYLDIDRQQGVFACIKTDTGYEIGGIGNDGKAKIDVYRTHLVTLFNIIEKIESEDDISNLLVALATGSGKTFVQALWMFILAQAGFNAVFGVPGKLLDQFKQDLSRLLPDNFVEHVLLLKENQESDEAREALRNLARPTTHSQVIVGSNDQLLDHHYQELLAANSDNTSLGFDEQHLIMKAERRRVRLIALAKQKLTMFLTATPGPETFELAGNKPVAIMSSGQKQQAGQGQFPHLFVDEAKNITDRNTLKNYRFWTREFWVNMKRGILLRFFNAIQTEHSSAAASIIDNLPFYLHRKAGETDARWRMQVPMAHKMLCIVDDNEALINFCERIQNPASAKENVYHQGNTVNRHDISDFFEVDAVDSDLLREDVVERQLNYMQDLSEDEQAVGAKLAIRSFQEQARLNIFHNMLEYVLSDITGLDEIQHNEKRKQDRAEFAEFVRNALNQNQNPIRNSEYYENKLKGLLDENGAREIAPILSALYSQLLRKRYAGLDFESIVDNWSVDDTISDKLMPTYTYSDLRERFDDYASSHLVVGVMSGMQQAETPVDESRPFLGFKREQYKLYDDVNGILVDRAKKRQRTTIEQLNDQSMETRYQPNYLTCDERVCDNYFRLGFVGVYVSNKKTEGFNDRHLHTVINVSESQVDDSNNPETLIQGIGRNRGLDDTVIPSYIHARGRKQRSYFNLDELKRDNYYPELFKAQQRYNKNFLANLGKKVSQKLLVWVQENSDSYDKVDEAALKQQVMKRVAQALREINNKNSHKIRLSRAQLTTVIRAAMNTLQAEIERLKKPYKLSLFVRVVGSMLNFFYSIYMAFHKVPAYFKLLKQAKSSNSSDYDKVYVKTIKATTFKQLVVNLSVFREFTGWLTKVVNANKLTLQKELDFYLKDETAATLQAYKESTVLPFFEKVIAPEKWESVKAAIQGIPYFLAFCNENQALLQGLTVEQADGFQEKILAFLHKVPGLEQLAKVDIINYPQLARERAQEFEGGASALLAHEALRLQMAGAIATYLKGPFLQQAQALFVPSEYKQVAACIAADNKAQDFANHLLLNVSQNALDMQDVAAVLTEFKTFFQLSDLALVDGRIASCMQTLQQEHEAIEANKFAHLNDATLTQLAQIIQTQLLPSLVNMFPLAERETLLVEATPDKIKQLLVEDGESLVALGEEVEPGELAVRIFSKLSSRRPLPDVVDIETEKQQAKASIANQFQAILKKNKASVFLGSLFSTKVSVTDIFENKAMLYQREVMKLLKSDEFLNAISMVLPYDQWLQLRQQLRLEGNNPALKGMATELIGRATNDTLNQLTPEEFIALCNHHLQTQFVGTEQSVQQAKDTLMQTKTAIERDPVPALKEETVTRLATAVRQQLLPILAMYIRSPEARDAFLQYPYDNNQLVSFLYNSKYQFAMLNGEDETLRKSQAQALINELVPLTENPLSLDDIADLKDQAETSGKQITQDFNWIYVNQYLTSEHFSKTLQLAYNNEDFARIASSLASEERVTQLTQACLQQGMESLNFDNFVELLKASDPALASIRLMNERVDEYKDYLEQLGTHLGDNLNQQKTAKLVSDSTKSIFFHPQLVSIMKTLIGSYTERELTLMINALGVAEPEAKAARVLQFIAVLANKNEEELQRVFLTTPTDQQPSLDNVPIKETMELVANLFQEILDCQCYYQAHNRRGNVGGAGVTPKLLSHISERLQDIQVGGANAKLGEIARRIFYIQGIRNSLPQASAINAAANYQHIAVLENMKNHMLKPLWWRVNLSKAAQAILDGLNKLSNTCKKIAHAVDKWLIKMSYFIIGKQQQTPDTSSVPEQDCEADVKHYATAINQLSPLDEACAQSEHCKIDVVADLEESAPTPRRSLQFFGQQAALPLVARDTPAARAENSYNAA